MIEMGCSFVEKQELRSAIQRACQENALLLPARKGRPHVSDPAFIAHRHGLDLACDLGMGCRFAHPVHIKQGIKETDVLGQTATEQPVILRHEADRLAPASARKGFQRAIVEQYPSCRRLDQPGHDPQKRRLAATGRTDKGDHLAGPHVERYAS